MTKRGLIFYKEKESLDPDNPQQDNLFLRPKNNLEPQKLEKEADQEDKEKDGDDNEIFEPFKDRRFLLVEDDERVRQPKNSRRRKRGES